MKTKHSKFWVALLMCIVIAVSTVMTAVGDINAATTSNPTFEVSTTSGHRGDEVQVTLSLTSNPGIAAGALSLVFDNSKLELVDVQKPSSAVLDGTTINANAKQDKSMNFIGYSFGSAENMTATGVLFTATFKILDNADFGDLSLEIKGKGGAGDIDISNQDEKSLTANVVNGKITVKCAHPESQREVTTTAATCTKDGSKVTTCKVCGETLSTETIKATGNHKYDAGTITKEPTCTETGIKTYICAVGGETKTEILPAKGHSYDAGKITTESTCTKTGVKTYTCTVCGETKTEEVPVKEHKYDAGTITKEPTCTETGIKTYTCTVGGETKTETIAALGHSYTTGTIVKENTETEDGILERTCTRCGKTETVVLPKLESKNFEVIAEDGNVLPTTIYTNGNVKFTLAGIGMNNANPNGGDIRYIPVRWKFALASDEATANWTEVTDNMELNASQAGEYVLVVEYMREMYQIPTAKARATVSGKWVADSNKTFVAKTSLKVEEAPVVDNNTTEDTNNNTTNNTTDNSNDESVKTADTSVYSITLMMMLMLVAASVAVYTGKSKRAR